MKVDHVSITVLRSILYIAYYKSMSVAGTKLNISQASISGSIKRYESKLGFRIFNRSCGKKSVTLTDEGRKVVIRIDKILHQYNKILQISDPELNLLPYCVKDRVRKLIEGKYYGS